MAEMCLPGWEISGSLVIVAVAVTVAGAASGAGSVGTVLQWCDIMAVGGGLSQRKVALWSLWKQGDYPMKTRAGQSGRVNVSPTFRQSAYNGGRGYAHCAC